MDSDPHFPVPCFTSGAATGLVVMVLMMAAGLSGCAPRILAPPIPPLNLLEIDTAPLQGKRIVIDPGHGGVFTGATGPGGLRESDVNLAVGLALWGLLKEAGADPVLTRSADLSRIPLESRELKADLQARVNVARGYDPDLFVSLHHNSDIHRRKRNETEIYYQMANPGASRDLAEALAVTFGTRGETKDVRVLPGNFYVLRNSPATAILGEASFMSNKPNERRLSLYGYLRLEAEVYFLGILEYFRKGVPSVTYPMASRENDGAALPILEEGNPLEAILSDSGGGGIDPASLEVSLDGLRVPFQFDPGMGRVSYLPPEDLPNGLHTFKVLGVNRNGRKTAVRDLTFGVARPPSGIRLNFPFAEIPPDGETLSRIEIRVEDSHGLPVADGTPVRLTLTAGDLLGTDPTIRDGLAVGYLQAPSAPGEGILRAESGEAVAELSLLFAPTSRSLLYGKVTDSSGGGVEGVAMEEEGRRIETSDREGFIFYQGIPGEHRFVLSRKGYHPREFSVTLGESPVRGGWELEPREEGIFHGRTIVLEGEGDDSRQMEMIRDLGRRLEDAGAAVVPILRSRNLRMEDRVLSANRTGGNFLLSFSADFPGQKMVAEYYYSSNEGKRLAGTLADSLEGRIREGGHFMVVHTGMTAVRLGIPSDLPPEETAEKIYRGIRDFLSADQPPEKPPLNGGTAQ